MLNPAGAGFWLVLIAVGLALLAARRRRTTQGRGADSTVSTTTHPHAFPVLSALQLFEQTASLGVLSSYRVQARFLGASTSSVACRRWFQGRIRRVRAGASGRRVALAARCATKKPADPCAGGRGLGSRFPARADTSERRRARRHHASRASLDLRGVGGGLAARHRQRSWPLCM